MRLSHIKLSGFKSFVDPTVITTPGQLVGIVGPNGCGKSNVIDAVRWVLGESKASALRGESMQDVIFNGAGERKPVGRASVELHFDNSQGRIGGQWGQYTEISIKRVLSRDGDSTYYINNIPVRRRDIHDLFLGTGLGPRAYAIIEQGMISRVIEAKPEELRIFLEEAAGVSKYKERRRETEGRFADTRENLARVEDIRQELGNQLTRLTDQARVATEYKEYEARLKQSQHLAWFAKQQDAARSRERCATEVAALVIALDSIHAELRGAEARLEALRSDHYAAGDVLHEKQGAFYAANAEVSRLEQQLSYARESETRLAAQVAQLTAAIGTIAGQEVALRDDRTAALAALETSLATVEAAAAEERAATAALPTLDQSLAAATQALAAIADRITLAEQSMRVAETRRESANRALAQLVLRKQRIDEELATLVLPASDPALVVAEQLAQEQTELAGRDAAVVALRLAVESLQQRQRETAAASEQASRALSDRRARAEALGALQAKIGHGKDIDDWLANRELKGVRRLWQAVEIEPGWEDALEAVLGTRLEALELTDLARAADWVADGSRPPRRIAAYVPGGDANGYVQHAGSDALLAKVQLKDPSLGRLLADGLHGVRCRNDLQEALADRHHLAAGESFVTPQGHLVSALGLAFFAPDSELHGVLARQRELEALAIAIAAATTTAERALHERDQVARDLATQQQSFHSESLALTSQQRRVHDLELELAQLKQAGEAAQKRRTQVTQDAADVAAQETTEIAQRDAISREIADVQSRMHDDIAQRDAARHVRNEADVAVARGRERLRVAERAAQEAGFAERSCRDRLAELERRQAALAEQTAQQQALLAQLTGEKASVDWTPIEAALQRQLVVRADAEQALAAARDRLEALGAQMREGDEQRMAIEQRQEPARAKIADMQLKEQAGALAEQQFTEQLTEAHADMAALPDALKAWGSARTLPAEIERLTQAIAGLGAVNMAALDELTQASERKSYLDRQSADLNEAMQTLETAIREIDRESRALLQQTFDLVNGNFARLFPTLFGGGQARLVLTGEEILDSGVQVVAQPPGKRNSSIHLLSGGEKALTAISLVFALFQINPAPFCLLDEVDAPLDDPNTERFCRMVQEMSKQTQFLFISHNKITMEMASQLVGITMPDPGVSRVVAVDIGEALSLTRAAA